MANIDVRLSIFEDNNFGGRRIRFTRGGVAIRNMNALRFDEELSSFRLQNVVNRNLVTLVLFSRNNFQGSFRVFRGSQSVANLGNFNNETESLIVVGRILTNAQIDNIRSTGVAPTNILEIRQ
ncbi:beta/gamma crystallin family protein [Paenibacillus agricola]|uniref:Beta/gamma crystallin family protein n=1 Tax=Paenibacillus agricola TaxID=2716264 RepID=A0ABX0J5T0_9BACL|nr:beta/gamma crystallin family protein [Paenibacillus agricola]NHN30193.1 beta/gamma crystallin family protein [Paenibacillus agricola]